MHAIKKKNPLAESFLVQLDVDLEIAGMEELRSLHSRTMRMSMANQEKFASYGRDTHGSRPCTESYQEAVRTGQVPTFGDNGIGSHASPQQTDKLSHLDLTRETAPVRRFPGDWMNIEIPNQTDKLARGVMTNQNVSIMANQNASMDMPTRQKTPSSSLDPSPRTLPDEMDFSGSNTNERSTPSSQQNNSSRVSTSGYTPPTLEHDDVSFMQFASYDPRKQSVVTIGEVGADTQPTSYGRDGTSEWPKDIFMNTPTETENTDFSQFAQHSSAANFAELSRTGFTPGTSGSNELFDLSEVEWSQVLDGMSGWEGISPRFPANTSTSGKL